MSVHVTHHAIDRYIERVAPIDRLSAREAILQAERSIETAAAFGGHVVRLPNGAKLIIANVAPASVVTVLAADSGPVHGRECRLTQPVCCGACGLRRSHPLARACVRTDCELAGRKGPRR